MQQNLMHKCGVDARGGKALGEEVAVGSEVEALEACGKR